MTAASADDLSCFLKKMKLTINSSQSVICQSRFSVENLVQSELARKITFMVYPALWVYLRNGEEKKLTWCTVGESSGHSHGQGLRWKRNTSHLMKSLMWSKVDKAVRPHTRWILSCGRCANNTWKCFSTGWLLWQPAAADADQFLSNHWKRTKVSLVSLGTSWF